MNHRPRAWIGFVALASLTLGAAGEVAAAVKVACIGEQTTHSDQFPSTGVGEYPWMLQMLLGAAWDTRNFGDCCATVLQGYPKQVETHPYLLGKPYMNSLPFAPDIVVIGSWGKHDTEIANKLYAGVLDAAKFQSDYDTLVTTYLNLASKPKVYVSLPVPIPKGAPQGVTTSVILPAVRAVADKYRLPVIDLYSSFLNHPELYKDDTHVSNVDGLQKIADLVYAALTAGADGGTPADAGGSGGADGSVDADMPGVDAGADASDGRGGAGGAGGGGSGSHPADAGSGGCACSMVPERAPSPWLWGVATATIARMRRRLRRG